MNEPEYRGNQCPQRGPGLSHTTDGSWRCVFCDKQVTLTPPKGVPETATEANKAPEPDFIFDHAWVMTISGRCGRDSCGKQRSEHVTWKASVVEGECRVDHRSLPAWYFCLGCNSYVEPKLASGSPQGPVHGRGRMPFTQRHYDDLETLYKAWMGGFYKS